MFAFDRSAIAVLVPLALLVGVVLMSRMDSRPTASPPALVEARRDSGAGTDGDQTATQPRDQTVAANLPSR